MTQQQMIVAIINAIQTDENVILIMRVGITNQLPNVQLTQLQNLCTALGIDWVDPPAGS